MIKNYNNLNNSANVNIETKKVNSNSTVVTKPTQLTKDETLFIKVDLKDINIKERVVNTELTLYLSSILGNAEIKVYKTNLTNLTNSNIQSASQTLNNTTFIGKKAIETTDISLDLTSAFNGEINGSKTVVFMVKTTLESNQTLTFKQPYEFCLVQTTEVSGLKGIYKYDSYPIENVGKVDVNLFDGNAIYSLDLFSTTGHMRPMGLTLYNNPLKENQVTCLPFNLTLNYHYKIYQEGEYYVIEDPTGAKNHYYQLDREDEITLANLHIKHRDNTGDIYFSNYDYSYFYVSGSSTKSVELYDQNDNYVRFSVGLTTKIMESKDSYGRYQTYTWSQDTLEKITNVDREEILFSYDSLGYMKIIDFTKQSLFVDFTRVSNYVEVRKYYTGTRLNSSSMEEPWDYLIDSARLEFDQNKITLVKDLKTNDYLKLTTDLDNKISNVSFHKGSEENKEFEFITNNNKYYLQGEVNLLFKGELIYEF